MACAEHARVEPLRIIEGADFQDIAERPTSYEGSGEGVPAPSSQAKPRPASFRFVELRPVCLDMEWVLN